MKLYFLKVVLMTQFALSLLLFSSCKSKSDIIISTWKSNECDVTLYKDGKVIVSGEGAMENYKLGTDTPKNGLKLVFFTTDAPWHAFKDKLKYIIFEDGVTHIGDYSFGFCENVEEVTLPSSLETIGNSAFSGTSIKKIVLPDAMTEIGESALIGCNKLEEIIIPDSVITVGKWAFGSTAIKRIELPDSMISIGEGAFYNCEKLEMITIPKSVTRIQRSTFENCFDLQEVIVSAQLEFIEDSAFIACDSLKNIKIPKSVINISNSAFDEGCQLIYE